MKSLTAAVVCALLTVTPVAAFARDSDHDGDRGGHGGGGGHERGGWTGGDRGGPRGDRGGGRGQDRSPDRGPDRGQDRGQDRGPDRGGGSGGRGDHGDYDRGGDRGGGDRRGRYDRPPPGYFDEPRRPDEGPPSRTVDRRGQDAQQRAREEVRQGRRVPLPAVIGRLRRDMGGEYVNARESRDEQGRPIYVLRFQQRGRYIDVPVDAETGQILR